MFIQNFAQTAADCTVNGQAADCEQIAKVAGGFFAGFGAFMIFIFMFAIVSFVFWVLSLVHLVKNEDVNDRVLWIVLVLLIPFANFIYFFGPRHNYEKNKPHGQNNGSTPGSDATTTSGVATGGAAAASTTFTPDKPVDSGVVGSDFSQSSEQSSSSEPVAPSISSDQVSTSDSDSITTAQAPATPSDFSSQNSSSDTVVSTAPESEEIPSPAPAPEEPIEPVPSPEAPETSQYPQSEPSSDTGDQQRPIA